MPIPCTQSSLADLSQGQPELFDDRSGLKTGFRLTRLLGNGGMSTVFQAERVGPTEGHLLATDVPQSIAVKIIQPSTVVSLRQRGEDPLGFVRREVVALQRLDELTPRCPNVIDYFGCGEVDVDLRGAAYRLPWVAIELVNGGQAGVTLSHRVHGAPDGIDPVRAETMVKSIFNGLQAIHSVGVIHRDLKPDNILVTGPVDAEQLKLSDCGISRVSGLATSMMAAVTPAYGGIEQFLPAGGVSNPLIGIWTDLHALAALVWFVIAGEQWHLATAGGEVSPKWVAGERRSLRTGTRLHVGFAAFPALAELDAVLARGASPRLPEVAITPPAANQYLELLVRQWPDSQQGQPRYADVATFRSALLPVLEAAAERWRAQAAHERFPVTQYRPTVGLSPSQYDLLTGAAYKVVQIPSKSKAPVPTLELRSRCVAFQPDGSALAASGPSLVFLHRGQAHPLTLPADSKLAARAQDAKAIVHAGTLGFAMASLDGQGVLFLRAGKWSWLARPAIHGREVGAIESMHMDAGRLAVCTGQTDDSEGASEIWWSSDGASWSAPSSIMLGGEGQVVSSSAGPYGTLVVGTRSIRNKQVAGAAFLAHDGASFGYPKGLGVMSVLLTALCGNEHESWAAGPDGIVRFARGTLDLEPHSLTRMSGDLSLALDPVGIPWLLTDSFVLRREHAGTGTRWRTVYERPAASAPLVAIHFSVDGALVVDATFSSMLIVPADITRWGAKG